MAASTLFTITMGKETSTWGKKIGPAGVAEPAEPMSMIKSKGFNMLVKHVNNDGELADMSKLDAPRIHRALAWSRKALKQVKQES